MCRAGVGATLIPRQFAEYMGVGESVRLFSLKQSVHTRQPAVITRKGQYLSEYAQYAIRLLAEQAGK